MIFNNKYVFLLSIGVIIVIFLYNVLVGSKGTYMNHTRLLWDEVVNTLKSPFTQSKPSRLKHLPYESSGERECRRVAELITGKPFPKVRPDFLRNTVTSSNLELDCYCDALKLAIEYNGEQHYRYIPHFHSSKESFYNTQYRDEIKARLCKENGIKLIIVPYTIALEDIAGYLRQQIPIAN